MEELKNKIFALTDIFKAFFYSFGEVKIFWKKKRIVRLLCSEWAFHKDSKYCIRRTKCLTCHDNKSGVSKTKWLSHPVKMINLLLATKWLVPDRSHSSSWAPNVTHLYQQPGNTWNTLSLLNNRIFWTWKMVQKRLEKYFAWLSKVYINSIALEGMTLHPTAVCS